jgi:peptide/nickel transport system substrate-binding protein
LAATRRPHRALPSKKRVRIRSWGALAGLAVTVLAVVDCRPSTPAVERPLRIAINGGPAGFDPHAAELSSLSLLRNLYDALTAFDAGDRIGPALATSWENPDELTWIFHLRQGVEFHNGRPFTSRDVLWSFARARRAASEIAPLLVAIDKVIAVNDYTVKITTFRAFPILLNKVAFVFIVPDGTPAEIRQPVGTGPYRLTGVGPESRLHLRAFGRYWGGTPGEPTVEFLPIPKPESRVQGLLSGDLDVIEDPSLADFDRLHSSPGCRPVEQLSLGVAYLSLNENRKPFSDPRVRRALSLALDRRDLAKTVLHGTVRPLGEMVSRNVFGYDPEIAVPQRDLAQAARLLASAGYAKGLDVQLQTREGRGQEVDAIVAQLAAAGIRARIVERPLEQFTPDADISFASWFCLSADASDFLDTLAHSAIPAKGYGTGNLAAYHNAQVDGLIEASATTLDLVNRQHRLQLAMRALLADDVYVPLYSHPLLYATRDNIEWQPRGDSLILANTIHRRLADR